jgi:hypothetical protein
MSICFLVLVLLNGATGSILAAVLCPHVPGVMTCCAAQKMEQHDHSDGMQMEMQGDTVADSDRQSLEVGLVAMPQESCAHCITHSQPLHTQLFLRASDQKDIQVLVAAPTSSLQFVPSAAFIYSISAMPHAPPWSQGPRYILLNVFRI